MDNLHCCICGNPLNSETKSAEHIIPNAIGGTLKSDSIYCKSCNSILGAGFDKEFTQIFVPLMTYGHFNKERKTNGGIYTGTAYDTSGEVYDVVLKNKKIIKTMNAKREYTNVDKEDLNILALDFKIDNQAFKLGLAKIAFNYAVYCGISSSCLEKVFDVKNRCLVEMPVVIPFFPITIFDSVVESVEDDELYHALHLFNIGNMLFCYIELFSTFQYYVLLSCNYFDNIIDKSYCNIIDKNEPPESSLLYELTPDNPKDAITIMTQYSISWESAENSVKRQLGIDKCKKIDNMNLVFNKIGEMAVESIRKNSYIKDYSVILQRKYNKIDFVNTFKIFTDKYFLADDYYSSFQYYIIYDSNEIDINNYKKTLPNKEPYPECCSRLIMKNIDITKYTHQKFMMLQNHLNVD